MNLAPIVLFVYNRPEHTRQTLEALMANELAAESTLIVYADGPKPGADQKLLSQIAETRRLIKERAWCKEVVLIESDTNKGLARSIVQGVTEVSDKYGKVIVLEDDIVTSKGFLKYMNDALTVYENEQQVMEISGFMFPVESQNLPDTFFYNANSCWGWGTWKRSWSYYNDDALDLYTKLINKKPDWLAFNAYQKDEFRTQLIANIEGRIKTWAVKWHTSMYLNNGFVLHPKISLTKNIGFDGTGVNCGPNENMMSLNVADAIEVNRINSFTINETAHVALKNYFGIQHSPKKRSFLSKVLLYIANRV